MGGQGLQIRFKAFNKPLVSFDFLGEVFEQLILQAVLLALMVSFHQLQTRNLHIQIHALLDTGVSGAQGLDLGKGQRRFVHIIAGADRAFAGHDLRNEFLFVLHRLPQVGIESSLGNIAVHMDQRILVALALDTALALGKVSRTPRTIQVMERHKPVLHIGASAHFGGAAQQDAHLPSANLGKQFFLLHLGLGFVDKKQSARRAFPGR